MHLDELAALAVLPFVHPLDFIEMELAGDVGFVAEPFPCILNHAAMFAVDLAVCIGNAGLQDVAGPDNVIYNHVDGIGKVRNQARP